MSPMRIGARFPNAGSLPADLGLAHMAQRLEAAGFDSLWVSDHLAMPRETRSTYPFSADGTMPWALDLGWSDAIVSLGIAAAVTERIELGTAILVAPLRNPLVTAIQVASVSVEAGGRFALGVGAGWLAEEFDAVGVPFERRGKVLDAWVDVVRSVWSGTLPVRDADGLFPNPTEMVCRPVPAAPVPILIGGLSPAAIRRAATTCDGWVALQSTDGLDAAALEGPISAIREQADEAGGGPPRITMQITGSAGRHEDVAGHLPALVDVGVDEIIVDVSWDDPSGPEAAYETLASARKEHA